jgi:hypothetical protein
MLLCTDGLTKHVSDDEIRDILLATSSSEATCRALVASMGEFIARDGFTQVPQLEGPARLLSSGFLEPPPGTRPPGNTAIWAQPPVPR